MNKKALIKEVAKMTGYAQANISEVIEAAINVIMTAVGNGETVTFAGFGKFYSQDRPEREGVNPQTGEKMTLKPSRTAKFKAGSAFKSAVAI